MHGGAVERSPSVAQHVLLFSSYWMSILSVAAPVAFLATVTADTSLGMTAADGALVLSLRTLASCFGKTVAGPLVQFVGAKKTLVLSYSLLAILLLALSRAETRVQFIICAILMQLANDPIYPSHTVIIKKNWKGSLQVSRAMWVISMSSRSADMATKVGYGQMLNVSSWRRLASRLAIFPLIGIVLSCIHSENREHQEVHRAQSGGWSIRPIMSVLTSTPYFWIAAASLAQLAFLKSCGQLVPLYFADVAPNVLSKGDATSMGLIFQFGMLLAVIFGARLYGTMKNKQRLCGLLLAGSVLASCALWWTSNTVVDSSAGIFVRGAAIFFLGLGIGVPYYIPIGVFSVTIGKENAATVSALLDAISNLFASGALHAVKLVLQSSLRWQGVWAASTFSALLASVITYKFVAKLEKLPTQASYSPVEVEDDNVELTDEV